MSPLLIIWILSFSYTQTDNTVVAREVPFASQKECEKAGTFLDLAYEDAKWTCTQRKDK